MYTDMYNTYDDEWISYDFPFSFSDCRKDYMEAKLPTYEMDYGDTTTIPFKIDKKYNKHSIHIIIYNFRFEEVYRKSWVPNSFGCPCDGFEVNLTINKELSSSIFKRGRYFCRVQAEYEDDYNEDVCTLLHPLDCTIWVK